MDPGTVFTVVELSFSLVVKVRKYIKEVKEATEKVKDLLYELESFHEVFERLEEFLKGDFGSKLPALKSKATVIEDALSEIEKLSKRLDAFTEASDSSKRQKLARMIGLKWGSLGWPFKKREINSYITKLQKHKDSVDQLLKLDHTYGGF